MSKAIFRNDSAGTIYLEEYGHQQILVTETVTIMDDNQETKFADSTQLNTLIAAGDIVYIDDLGADRTAADATQILEGMRDKVLAGGVDGEYLCTNATGDLVWGAGAIVIKDEGVQVSAGNCTAMNFTGPPITVTDAGGGQVDVTVAALMDILEDTTPQLGGMLDVNGFAIGNGTEELIIFVETGSAVNEITVANAATGNGPSITATGADSDVDLVLAGKGTGVVNITGGLLVAGDLTVSGTTTTINTTDLAIADNQIFLNSDHTGAPTQNAGILIERGSSTDASLLWDETADVWKVGIAGSEVEVSVVGHIHVTGDITSGTFADGRIASSNVTQHQAALSITESQISDLQSYSLTSHNHTLDGLSNTTITAIASNEILKWDGAAWINNTLAEAGIAATVHTHVEADITDLQAYLLNVVQDTTPQLGGMLDVNGNGLGDGTRLLLGFVEDASAVNYIEIENNATGTGPIIRAVGTDSDIDLSLNSKGTGVVSITGNVTVSGTVDGRDLATDGTKLDGIEAGATADQSNVEIKTAYEANADTNEFSDAEQTKLAGIATGAIANIVEDTTPQLGGMLDVNGNGIGDGTNLLLDWIEDPSGVNHLQIENGATGEGAYLRAVGADTNVDLNLEAQGTGVITVTTTIKAKGTATDADLVLDTQGAGVINASTNIIQNVVDPVSAQDAATKNYVDANTATVPTGLTDFHEVWHFYEQGATGDIYMMRADSLVGKQFPGSVALANGQVVHVTSAREKSPTKYCDIVVRKQTASTVAWSTGTWTNVGTALLMNNTILSDTYTNLTGYTFNAGDAIAVYLDKTTPVGGASCEDPFVALYVKYD